MDRKTAPRSVARNAAAINAAPDYGNVIDRDWHPTLHVQLKLRAHNGTSAQKKHGKGRQLREVDEPAPDLEVFRQASESNCLRRKWV